MVLESLQTAFYGKRSTKTQHKLKQDPGGDQRGKALSNVNSKMVGCAVTSDTSFAQFRNREYKTVNKVTLLNSTYINPLRTNVNKRLAVK